MYHFCFNLDLDMACFTPILMGLKCLSLFVLQYTFRIENGDGNAC